MATTRNHAPAPSRQGTGSARVGPPASAVAVAVAALLAASVALGSWLRLWASGRQRSAPLAAPRPDAPPGPVWVILPTYNEADNIEALVAAVRGVLAGAAPAGFTVLVVDDSSPDGTGALADGLAAAHGDVEVLHRARKDGLAQAYFAGFDRALERGAAYVVQMDADFSHDPADLVPLLARARRSADVVLGSRYVPGGSLTDWGALRRLVSRMGSWYARSVLGVPVRDLTGGFKCFRADALRRIEYRRIRSRGYAFQIDMTYTALRGGLRVEEIPIVFRDRQVGSSKMTTSIALEAAWRVVAMRRRRWRPGPAAQPGSTPARVSPIAESSPETLSA